MSQAPPLLLIGLRGSGKSTLGRLVAERIGATFSDLDDAVLERLECATVAEAWDALYHLERAAKTLVLAYSTGQPLQVMPDDLAEATAAEWEVYKDAEFAHFAEMKRVLDIEEPDYKD